MEEREHEIEVIETITTTVSETVIEGGEVIEADRIVVRDEVLIKLEPHGGLDVTLIAPSGHRRELKYHGHELVGEILTDGVKYFGDRGELDPKAAYELVKAGNVLPETETLKAAGIHPGDRLSIRTKSIPVDG